MMTNTNNGVKSWSYSSLALYEQCPQKFKFIKIDKMEEPSSYHLIKGSRTHKEAEDYLNGVVKSTYPSMMLFKNEFENLRKNNAIAEEAIVLDKNWNLITAANAWTHEDAWLRLKLDARVDNFAIDFKTGKQYPSHKDQAELYALVLLIIFKFEHVEIELWYLDYNLSPSYSFYSKEIPELKAKWEEKINPMFNDTKFLPKKNQYCGNCFFKKICPLWKN